VAPSNAPATGRSDERGGPPLVGYVLAGVGVVGIAVGAVTGILALDRQATMEGDGCDPDAQTCRTQAGVDAASSGEILSAASTIAFAVGGVSLGVGGYLILFTESDGKSAGAPPPARARGIVIHGAF
jgi:hypothetical protein